MRWMSVTSSSSSSAAFSPEPRSEPASAAAIIDGCLVASVKPNSCIMRKLTA